MIKINKGHPFGAVINIHVPGQPAHVTHQSGTKYNARTKRTYKTADLIAWENRIRMAAECSAPEKPLEGPLLLIGVFFFETKDKKKKGTWKESKPDTDNMMKTPKDILGEMNFFKIGDQQVVLEICLKQWCDEGQEPGLCLTLSRMTENVL